MSGLKRNIVATVPATLAEGHEVFVGSGSQYAHYIGNASNVPVSVKEYLEYSAILNQSGTDAPVATVLKNDLGGTVVWSRSSVGVYVGTLSSAFPASKTQIILGTLDPSEPEQSHVSLANTNSITITTYIIDAETDNLLNNTTLIIRVYP